MGKEVQGIFFMVKRNIDGKILSQIKDYRKVLEKNKIKVEKLILFGSYTKGTPKEWSDIDLCVVSPQFGKNRFEERVRLMKLSLGGGENIEPHPYNPKDLENKWDSLASEINKYGIEISS